MESIQKSLNDMMTLFNSKMEDFQCSLQQANPSPNVTSLATDFANFRSFIGVTMGSLQKQVALLSQQQEQFEMNFRRNILLLHGLSEGSNEDLVPEIVRMANSKFKIANFSEADIARCYRLGRSAVGGKPRPILIEFLNISYKDKFWHAKTVLKGSGLTLSEYLTKIRHQAFMAARQHFGVNKCWTRDGCVLIIGHDGSRHRVCTVEDVNRLRGNFQSEVLSVKPAAEVVPAGGISATKPAMVPAASAVVGGSSSRPKRVVVKK